MAQPLPIGFPFFGNFRPWLCQDYLYRVVVSNIDKLTHVTILIDSDCFLPWWLCFKMPTISWKIMVMFFVADVAVMTLRRCSFERAVPSSRRTCVLTFFGPFHKSEEIAVGFVGTEWTNPAALPRGNAHSYETNRSEGGGISANCWWALPATEEKPTNQIQLHVPCDPSASWYGSCTCNCDAHLQGHCLERAS